MTIKKSNASCKDCKQFMQWEEYGMNFEDCRQGNINLETDQGDDIQNHAACEDVEFITEIIMN